MSSCSQDEEHVQCVKVINQENTEITNKTGQNTNTSSEVHYCINKDLLGVPTFRGL